MTPEQPYRWAVRAGETYEYLEGLPGLQIRHAEGKLLPDDEVWVPGQQRWIQAKEFDLRSDSEKWLSFRAGVARLVPTAIFGCLVVWVVYSTLIAPNRRLRTPLHPDQVSELSRQATIAFTDPGVRVEERHGANVRIYLERESFEGVPFPDRDATVEALGKSWCTAVEGTYMPTVEIHDIRSGRKLASFGCAAFKFQTWWRDTQASSEHKR